MAQKNLNQRTFFEKNSKICVIIYTYARRIFFLLLFEMIKSSSLDRELLRLIFSKTEEDSEKGNKKTTQQK